MAIAGLMGFFFIQGKSTFLVFTLIEFAAIAVIQGALATIGPRLMPRQRYGQFCAANAMVVESGLLGLSWLCGVMLDHYGERYVHMWASVFAMLGLLMLVNLFIAWKKHGGDDHFVAPGDFVETPQSLQLEGNGL
jgi:predicted MFS family arabinose efflux permease